MMPLSRRQLANYAVQSLLAGAPPAEIAKRLAAALKSSRASSDYELLLSDIDQELEDRGILARARVTVSAPLQTDLERELIAKVANAAKVKAVAIDCKVDKSIIGGIRVETANHSWDKTISRALTRIKEAINE